MENYLYHHGIKGMRWGVRRTEAQLARARGKVDKYEAKLAAKTGGQKSSSSDAKPKEKSLEEMTDAELFAKVNRLNMEKRYKELNPEKVSKGKQFIKSTMDKVVIPAVQDVAKNTLKQVLTDSANAAIKKSAESSTKKK